jgi:hypothetical protein
MNGSAAQYLALIMYAVIVFYLGYSSMKAKKEVA